MSTQQESFAEDIYRINKPNSLVTASHEDLASLMALNARHMRQATASKKFTSFSSPLHKALFS
jgi:hypothetical protein